MKSPIKLKRIRTRGPLGEKVYQILKEAIIHGRLAPGTWLQEEQLTQAMGISRTPLREAIHRLTSEGLVEVIPRKGAHVIELSDDDLADLFEAREVIETVFLVRSAQNMSPADFQRIRDSLTQAEKEMVEAAADPGLFNEKRQRYLEADRALHDELIIACGNKSWVKLYYNIRDRIEFYGHQISHVPSRFRVAIEGHLAILDALLAGEFVKAQQLMKEHIRNMPVSIAEIRDQIAQAARSERKLAGPGSGPESGAPGVGSASNGPRPGLSGH